jgi:TRAP transporter TAXI family solute receptor
MMTTAKTEVSLATATPGGGFPLFGGAAAETINETDPSLNVVPRNTRGSAENIGLLERGEVDIALVAGEPAYEAFAGIGRAPTTNKIISAIYSNPGMFAVKADSPAHTLRDLIRKPIAWGTHASGLTLLGRYVTDGLGLDREKDFEAHYLDKARDGPLMVADGRVAALWGGGIGWPGFTAVMAAGGRFIGLTPEEIVRVTRKHNFLKPITVPAGAYAGQTEPVNSTRIVPGTACQKEPAARHAAMSVEPRPVPKAPSAPYVQVCESPPAITDPGTTQPSSTSSVCSIPPRPCS